MSKHIIVGLNSFGKDALICFSGAFFAYYLTDIIVLSPSFIGWLLLTTRVIDAFATLFVGYLLDYFSAKEGVIKWFYALGGASYALAFPFLFFGGGGNPSFLLALYLSMIYLIYDLSQTVAEVAFWAWLPSLVSDENGRSRLFAMARFFASLSALVSIGSGLYLVDFFGGGNLQIGFFKSACLLSSIYLILLLVQVIKLPNSSPQSVKQGGFKERVSLIAQNRPLLFLFLTLVLFELGVQLMNAMTLYYFKYVVGDIFYFSLYIFTILIQMLGTLAYAKLKPSMSGHQLFGLATTITIVGLLSLYVVGVFAPSHALLVFVTGSIKQFGTGVYMVAASMDMVSCMDYSRYRFGNALSGSIVALQNFSLNLALALSAWLVGVGLSGMGYAPNQEQLASTLLGIRLLTCLVPALFIGLSYAIYRLGFLKSLRVDN